VGDEFWRFRTACRVMPAAAADSRIVHPSSSFRRISLPRQSSFMGVRLSQIRLAVHRARLCAGKGTTGQAVMVALFVINRTNISRTSRIALATGIPQKRTFSFQKTARGHAFNRMQLRLKIFTGDKDRKSVQSG
jgi:hypothetical protein